MATKTFDELKQLAIQIRDEKTNKQNTANRVGTAMLEGINKLEQDYYNKTTTDEELKKRDDKLTELNKSLKENSSFSNFPLSTIYLPGSQEEALIQNFRSSAFIKVKEGDKFYVDLDAGDGQAVQFYTIKDDANLTGNIEEYADLNPDNFTYISGLSSPQNGLITIPSGVDCVRFQSVVGIDKAKGYKWNIKSGQAFYMSESNPLVKLLSTTYNEINLIRVGDISNVKKILFFGDSIVYGSISGNIPDYQGNSTSWVNRFCNMLGVTGANHGIGGYELTTDRFFNNIVSTEESDVDMIIIGIGANDCTRATVPIGTIDDTSNVQSVHGIFKKVVNKLREKWGNLRIVFIAVYDIGKSYQGVFSVDTFNEAIYQECVINQCGYITKEWLGFPNENSPIYSKYLADKLHPTGFSSDVYANAIMSYFL